MRGESERELSDRGLHWEMATTTTVYTVLYAPACIIIIMSHHKSHADMHAIFEGF